MAQPYYARKTELKIGNRRGETVFSAQPYYYGTISTGDVAKQIAQESALTQADVIGVIERLAYFCQTHMALGYKVQLEGMGTLCNEFITLGSVSKPEDVNAKLIKSIRPKFSPEYTIVNGTFRYALLPERTEVVKIDYTRAKSEGGSSANDDAPNCNPPSGGGSTPGGDTPSGGDGDNTGGDNEPPSLT